MNQYNLLYNNVPFGGKKQSGIGKQFVDRLWRLYLGTDSIALPPAACENPTTRSGDEGGAGRRRD